MLSPLCSNLFEHFLVPANHDTALLISAPSALISLQTNRPIRLRGEEELSCCDVNRPDLPAYLREKVDSRSLQLHVKTSLHYKGITWIKESNQCTKHKSFPSYTYLFFGNQ